VLGEVHGGSAGGAGGNLVVPRGPVNAAPGAIGPRGAQAGR
jgi:hypothetical protein